MSEGYLEGLRQHWTEHPWFSLFYLILAICLTTAVLTNIGSNTSKPVQTETPGVYTVPQTTPFFIPFFNLQYLYLHFSTAWLGALSSRFDPKIFSLRHFWRTYVVVGSAAYIEAVLYTPDLPVTSRRYRILQARRFFGNRLASESAVDRVQTATHRCALDISRAARLRGLLEANTYNLISPSRGLIDRAQWERGADVKILSSTKAKPSELCVSASLPVLIREFTGYIIVSTIVGSSFLDSHPDFIDNLFAFARKHRSFMFGWPYWIVPGLGPPALAKERCLLALENLVDALLAKAGQEGRDTARGTSVLYDLDDVQTDVQNMVYEAWKELMKIKQSRRSILRSIACEILEVIWSICYDSANIVTWMLIDTHQKDHTYAQRVMDELKKMVSVEQPEATGLAFEDPPRLHFTVSQEPSHQKLMELCPILSEVLLKVRRERTRLEEYLDVSEDCVLRVGSNISGANKHQPDKSELAFRITKGNRLCVAHWLHFYHKRQSQKSYTSEPTREENIKDQITIRRNRYFANRAGSVDICGIMPHIYQIQYAVAAILSMYSFEAVEGGPLGNLSYSTTAGICIPSDSYRAKISRRQIE